MTWRCRFNRVFVAAPAMLLREVRCTNDAWRTSQGSTATTAAPAGGPAPAHILLYDGEHWSVNIQLVPCVKDADGICAPAAELP